MGTITMIKETKTAQKKLKSLKGKSFWTLGSGRKYSGNLHIMPNGHLFTGATHKTTSKRLTTQKPK